MIRFTLFSAPLIIASVIVDREDDVKENIIDKVQITPKHFPSIFRHLNSMNFDKYHVDI